jgi:hypothetical protein
VAAENRGRERRCRPSSHLKSIERVPKKRSIHLSAKGRMPAREKRFATMPPDIYLSQQAQLKARAGKSAWDNVALCPDVVVSDVFGNPASSRSVVSFEVLKD